MSKSPSFLRQVLAATLGTIIGMVISSVILFFVFLFSIIGIIAAFSGQATEVVDVKTNSVLKISLKKEINERENRNPLAGVDFPFSNAGNNPMGLLELREVLKRAANDKNISGLYLDMGRMQAGMATITELRTAIADFKQSGKFVVAYGEDMLEREYYLASVADEVYVSPTGLFEFNGFYSEILFFKGTLEKLGIKALEFRTGDYKSAVEAFVRDSMSTANREQLTAYIQGVYDKFLQDISEARNVPVSSLRQLSDNLVIGSSGRAAEEGLITAARYYNEVEDILRSKLGEEVEEVSFVTYNNYKRGLSPGVKTGDRVAVVYATGNIVSGTGNEFSSLMGSDDIVKQLRKVREDDRVKAVVLRINSPGGSALASDIMWKEVELLREKKPVVASMSDIAASGGYYIAMGCDHIIAHENTLTGSIGVIYLLFNMQEFLNEKLGMNADGVKVGKHADIGNATREMTAREKQLIQEQVLEIYETFLTKAAQGRGMETADIQALAGGRIWTGGDALSRGLIDEIGGLEKAVEVAAAMVDIKDVRVEYVEGEPFNWRKWMGNLQVETSEQALEKHTGQLYPYLQQVEYVKQFEGVQARLPFELIIR